MTDSAIHIEIKGMKELQDKMAKFPREVKKYLAWAGEESAKEILDTKGLQNYPGETAANKPPTPYYIRTQGMMYKSGLKATSENMKALWKVESKDYKTTISNSASYAKWVHGEQQARAMNAIGWRKLVDVAKESVSSITTIYNRWVNKLLRDLKL